MSWEQCVLPGGVMEVEGPDGACTPGGSGSTNGLQQQQQQSVFHGS